MFMVGRTVVISAGGTREHLDPVPAAGPEHTSYSLDSRPVPRDPGQPVALGPAVIAIHNNGHMAGNDLPWLVAWLG